MQFKIFVGSFHSIIALLLLKKKNDTRLLQFDIHGTFWNHTLDIYCIPTLYSTLDNNCKNLFPEYRPLFEYTFNKIQVMFYSQICFKNNFFLIIFFQTKTNVAKAKSEEFLHRQTCEKMFWIPLMWKNVTRLAIINYRRELFREKSANAIHLFKRTEAAWATHTGNNCVGLQLARRKYVVDIHFSCHLLSNSNGLAILSPLFNEKSQIFTHI